MIRIYRRFSFEAAHFLPRVAEGHKCRRLHGHSYSIELHAAGEMNEQMGWLFDLGALDEAFAPLREQLDHRCLNDIPGLENPTSEHLALWLWQRLKPTLPELSRIVVSETPESGCVYEPDERR